MTSSQYISNPNTLLGLDETTENLQEQVADLQAIVPGNVLLLDGTNSMNANLNNGGHNITNVNDIGLENITGKTYGHEIRFDSGDLFIGTSDIGDSITFRISKSDTTPELTISNNLLTLDANLDLATNNLINGESVSSTNLNSTNLTSTNINGTYMNVPNITSQDITSSSTLSIHTTGSNYLDLTCDTGSNIRLYQLLTELGKDLYLGGNDISDVQKLLCNVIQGYIYAHEIQFNNGDLLLGTATINDKITFRVSKLATSPEITIQRQLITLDGDLDMNGWSIQGDDIYGTIRTASQPYISALAIQTSPLDMGNNDILNANNIYGIIRTTSQPYISSLAVQTADLNMGNNDLLNVKETHTTYLSATNMLGNLDFQSVHSIVNLYQLYCSNIVTPCQVHEPMSFKSLFQDSLITFSNGTENYSMGVDLTDNRFRMSPGTSLDHLNEFFYYDFNSSLTYIKGAEAGIHTSYGVFRSLSTGLLIDSTTAQTLKINNQTGQKISFQINNSEIANVNGSGLNIGTQQITTSGVSNTGSHLINNTYNGANALRLQTSGGTSSNIVLVNSTGTGTNSLHIKSTLGGVIVDGGTQIDFQIGSVSKTILTSSAWTLQNNIVQGSQTLSSSGLASTGNILISSMNNSTSALILQTNGGAGDRLQIKNLLSSSADAILLTSSTGGITQSANTSLNLQYQGANKLTLTSAGLNVQASVPLNFITAVANHVIKNTLLSGSLSYLDISGAEGVQINTNNNPMIIKDTGGTVMKCNSGSVNPYVPILCNITSGPQIIISNSSNASILYGNTYPSPTSSITMGLNSSGGAFYMDKGSVLGDSPFFTFEYSSTNITSKSLSGTNTVDSHDGTVLSYRTSTRLSVESNTILINHQLINSGTLPSALKVGRGFGNGNSYGLLVQPETGYDADGVHFSTFCKADGTIIGYISKNSSTSVAYNTSSDRRKKTNIEEADNEECLQSINEIQLKKYNWKDDPNDNQEVGVIAQEIKQHSNPKIRRLISCACNGLCCNKNHVCSDEEECKCTLNMNYPGLIPHLLGAIQEQNKLIEKLTKRIEILETNIL